MIRRLKKTSLAWSNLTHDLKRLAASMAGIGFAVVLIFTELGFLDALLSSTGALLQRLHAAEPANTLLVIHKDKETVTDQRRFARRWLVRIKGYPEVTETSALYSEASLAAWHNPRTGTSRKIRVVASDSERLLSGLAGAQGNEVAARLRPDGTALFDIRSKGPFGYEQLPHAGLMSSAREAWVARKPLRIVDTFDLGTDFVYDGTLLMGLRTFDALFPTRRVYELDERMVDIGVIRLDEGADASIVRAKLEAGLAQDVRLRFLTLDEMIAKERAFWDSHTPVSWIFWMGVMLGFIVGVVICFQVLSSDIRDHLPEYATLKAIGYGNTYLVKVVCRQAAWLAVLGFLPGTLLAWLVYVKLRAQTGLPMQMAAVTIAEVFALTLAMCLSAACFAIRKLFKADPVELFR
jgi:putative ABC transport system permease protein